MPETATATSFLVSASSTFSLSRALVPASVLAAVVSLLDRVVAPTHAHWLLNHAQSLLQVFAARDRGRGLGDVHGEGVLNFHDSVVKLGAIVALDGLSSRGGLDVDQRGGPQVLPVHVLVEASTDQVATVREKFLHFQTK